MFLIIFTSIFNKKSSQWNIFLHKLCRFANIKLWGATENYWNNIFKIMIIKKERIYIWDKRFYPTKESMWYITHKYMASCCKSHPWVFSTSLITACWSASTPCYKHITQVQTVTLQCKPTLHYIQHKHAQQHTSISKIKENKLIILNIQNYRGYK